MQRGLGEAANAGLRTSKHWVLRLMREHDILALGMAPTD